MVVLVFSCPNFINTIPYCLYLWVIYFFEHEKKIFDWKTSSEWLESWEGLLLVTDVSTTCAEAIFRVKKICDKFLWEKSSIQSRFWAKNLINSEWELEKVGQLFQVVIHLDPCYPWQCKTVNSLRTVIQSQVNKLKKSFLGFHWFKNIFWIFKITPNIMTISPFKYPAKWNCDNKF